jgi:type VI secretion system secreted protein Hcp
MQDIYFNITGPNLSGESQDKDHSGWIEATSFSHNIIQPKSATASTAGGHTAERAEHGDITLSKVIDLVSPTLYQHSSGGTTFDNIAIEFFRADGEGKRVKYLDIQLKKAIISSVNYNVGEPDSDASDNSGLPTEVITFSYAAIQWKYMQQKIGGGQGGTAQGAWSLTKNDKTFSI